MIGKTVNPGCLRLSAALLLVGQILYIVVTQLHTGGDANSHPAVFAAYAASPIWKAVHLGQFGAMAILSAGLLALFLALDTQSATGRWARSFGAALAVAALALYGALQAVDGIALKQAVDAWMNAPDGEKAARFASAEAIRWLEWGLRSYQNLALGLALVLFAVALWRLTAGLRRIAGLMALAGLSHLLQGWVVGVEGFSSTETITIVGAFVLNLAWMTGLAVVAWRLRDPEVPSHDR
ncbi:MAG: hypothetical protein RIC56_10220 [Pseudomonadales bacterium]